MELNRVVLFLLWQQFLLHDAVHDCHASHWLMSVRVSADHTYV